MSLYKDASLVMIPSAYKDGKLYSIRPVPEYGAELVTNGTFATDSDWDKGAGWTISGGAANSDGTGNNDIRQTFSIPTGTLKIKFNVTAITQGSVRLFINKPTFSQLLNINSIGSYEVDVDTTSNSGAIYFFSTNNFIGSIDNVSVKEVLKPSGDFTFSRGSNLAATRVDVNGLIEKGRENVLPYSNAFTSGNWSTYAATATNGQGDRNGGTDAWKLEISSTSGNMRNLSLSFTGVHTFAVYLKGGTLDWVKLEVLDASVACWFDVTNGVKGTTSGAIIDSKIEAVGNGYYRCSITGNFSGGYRVSIIAADGNGTTNASSGNFYFQDAQLEQGLVATDYIETGTSAAQSGILEDMPRLDYSGGASCPSLLLEPQRTNQLENSEYFGSWNNTTYPVTITSNAATSPDGNLNATLITPTSGSSRHATRDLNVVAVAGTTYTLSVFFKKVGSRYVVLGDSGDNLWRLVTADLDEGTITDETNATGTIEPYENDWYRITCTFTRNNPPTIQTFLGASPVDTNTSAPTFDDTSLTTYVYGAQVEASSSYPTSYIPTYGTSQTRSKDAASLVGTDLLDQDNQTLFIEYTKGGVDGSANTIYSTSDGTSSANRMQIVDNNDDVYIYSNAGGTNILNNTNALLLSNLETGDTIKVAVVMTTTSIKAFANGVEKVDFTDSFSWSVTMDDLYIGARGGSSEPPKGQGVKQALVFPTALTDSECIALTTL